MYCSKAVLPRLKDNKALLAKQLKTFSQLGHKQQHSSAIKSLSVKSWQFQLLPARSYWVRGKYSLEIQEDHELTD